MAEWYVEAMSGQKQLLSVAIGAENGGDCWGEEKYIAGKKHNIGIMYLYTPQKVGHLYRRVASICVQQY